MPIAAALLDQVTLAGDAPVPLRDVAGSKDAVSFGVMHGPT